MFHAMERSELDTLYIIGENPAQSEADQEHAVELLRGLKHLIVQDIFLTKTGELAEVVFPASASWCESEGTVTSSERRVQRCRKALDPPGEARDDIAIICELARRLGHDWPDYTAEQAWDECRALSPWHAGMSYERLEELGGIPWPCYDENHPGELFLHSRLWENPIEGERAPFAAVEHDPPVEALDDEYPMRLDDRAPARLVQHRRAERRLRVADAARRDARHIAARRGALRRCRRRFGARHVASRFHRRSRPHRSGVAPGAGVYDLPLQRRRRDESLDDRRDRSEVGHGGVQSVRRAHRPAEPRPSTPARRAFAQDDTRSWICISPPMRRRMPNGRPSMTRSVETARSGGCRRALATPSLAAGAARAATIASGGSARAR